MFKDVIAVKPLGGYRIWIRFEDGVEGDVDLGAEISFTGVFEPLKDPAYFAKVHVNPDLGTICWPNDADIDPVVLYGLVKHQPIPDYRSVRAKATD